MTSAIFRVELFYPEDEVWHVPCNNTAYQITSQNPEYYPMGNTEVLVQPPAEHYPRKANSHGR
jgi:hypothetical protein